MNDFEKKAFDDYFTVKIDITGMAVVINGELAVIRKALEDTGFDVKVINNSPSEANDEDYIANLKSIHERNPDKKNKVLITMNHLNWPG